MRLARGRVLLMLGAAALAAPAQEPPWNFQVSAYGTLGATTTTSGAVGFRRNNDQPGGAGTSVDWNVDSRFGVQFSSKLGDSLLATVQVVSRYQADGTNRPEVTWACLGWTPFKGFRVRAGILGQEVQPTQEPSELGYAYVWVRPPVEVFGTDNILSINGIELDQDVDLGGDRSLRLVGYAGGAAERINLDHVGLWDVRGARTYGGGLIYRSGEFFVRAGSFFGRFGANLPGSIALVQEGLTAAGAYFGDPAPAAAARGMNLKGRASHKQTLDFWYDRGPGEFRGALYRTTSDSPLLPATWRGYLTYSRHLGAFSPYATFSRVSSKGVPNPDLGTLPLAAQGPLGPEVTYLMQGTDTIYHAGVSNQSTWSAGVRWDFAPKMDLKFQVDRIRSHDLGGLLYDPNAYGPPDWNGRLTVFSLALDFILGGGR